MLNQENNYNKQLNMSYGRGAAAQHGSNASNFAKMLENCENFDNDIRFTGANDLCNEITKAAE